jgi:F-type H+-transporting ATPase subunit a
MAFLVAGSWLGMRHARVQGGTLQELLEIVVETAEAQLHAIIGGDVTRYLPLLGTLFLFIATANLTAVLPGTVPPTGQLETPAALAMIVFLSIHAFGIEARGLGAYLGRYLRPNPLLLPLNVLADFTRTFALTIRLFGNVMSHELVLAILLLLAGLLVPVPFMLLGMLIGLIQAYIFTVLAAVFIGAAVSEDQAP